VEIAALLQRLVANTPGGFDAALSEINAGRSTKMSAQVLHNKLNHLYPDDQLNESQTLAIIRAINCNVAVASHFAEKGNAVVMILPAVPAQSFRSITLTSIYHVMNSRRYLRNLMNYLKQ
jgi:hypothetical protein